MIEIVREYARGLRPPPKINMLQFADSEFVLPRESTAEYGRYRSARTPFVREILLALSPDDPAEKVVVMKPVQSQASTLAHIALFYWAKYHPGPCRMWFPREKTAEGVVKKKIEPALRESVSMHGVVAPRKLKTSGQTILEWSFPGGSWSFVGAESPASFDEASVRYAIGDDLDRWPLDVGGEKRGEGSPVKLIGGRTSTFSNSKTYLISTPTIKDASAIESEYLKSSMGRYNIPCPFCNEFQVLWFKNLKFDSRDIENCEIWYQCEFCGGKITEDKKQQFLEDGKYIHEFPDRVLTRGFWWNALYTPFKLGKVGWRFVASDFLDCKGVLALKTWTNLREAKTFEEEFSRPKWKSLMARAEPYRPYTAPPAVLCVVAGVDVHPDKLFVSIYGFGYQEESWLIHYSEIIGPVESGTTWKRLDEVINYPISRADGVQLSVELCAVDSKDGETTQTVRRHVRFRQPRMFCCQGGQVKDAPAVQTVSKQDITIDGEKIIDGIEMWTFGVTTIKKTIYRRLELTQPGPEYIHFFEGLPEEFYRHLTSERYVTELGKKTGKEEKHFVRFGPNEPLDTAVYALGAGIRAGISYMMPTPPPPPREKERKREQKQFPRKRW